jgi:hypothetical protein
MLVWPPMRPVASTITFCSIVTDTISRLTGSLKMPMMSTWSPGSIQ